MEITWLCREGQLEIDVQEARKLRPVLSDAALLALAKTYRDFPGMVNGGAGSFRHHQCVKT